jgi:hypothetical protein
MSFIINILAKLGGISKLWGFLDGYKTKIGGTATFLAGLASLIAQLIPIIEGKDTALLLAFIKGLPQDQAVLAMTAGLGIMGIGHKLDKVDAPTTPSQPK